MMVFLYDVNQIDNVSAVCLMILMWWYSSVIIYNDIAVHYNISALEMIIISNIGHWWCYICMSQFAKLLW